MDINPFDGDGLDASGAGSAAAVALLALAGKKVPVRGLETVFSLLSKQGQSIGKVASDLGPLRMNLNDRLLSNEELLNRGLIRRADILDASRYNKDFTRNYNVVDPDATLGTPTTLISSKDLLPFDTKLVPGTNTISGYLDEAPRKNITVNYKEGTNKPGTSLNRVARANRVKNVNLNDRNITTDIDVNNPVALEAALANLSETALNNRSVIGRVDAVRAADAMKGNALTRQLRFIKDFRNVQAQERIKIREELDVAAESLAAKLGISYPEARARVSKVFGQVSPNANLKTNWDRFYDVVDNLDDAQLDEFVRTPAGRKWYANAVAMMKNRAQELANTGFANGRGSINPELLERTAGDNVAKVPTLVRALDGESTAVADRAELDRLLSLVIADAPRRDEIMQAAFSNPELYKRLTDSLNEAFSSGVYKDTSWLLSPRGGNIADIQSGVQRRGNL
jgi:hypothetical protein